MKLGSRPNGNLLTGLVVLVCGGAIMVNFLTDTPHGTSSSSSASESPTATSTVAPVSTPASAPLEAKRMNKLKKEVSNFVATYYLIFPGPEETEASRRQRMAPKVSATVLSRLNFGLKIATVAGIRRTQDKLIQKGQALTDQLRVGKDSSDKAALYVSVPVRLYLVDKDDKEVVSYLPIATVSKWRYSDGAWHLLGFSEGDDAE